jgi:predicted Zn-dependent peptidase
VKSFIVILALLLIVTTENVFSQMAQSKLDRSKPPKPGNISKVSFPKYFERQLPNGARVFVIENHEQPILSITIVCKGGSSQDGKLPGLASVTAELLTKGTTTRSATQIAEEIDFVGGSLNSSSGWDANQTSVVVLKKHLDVGLAILADVILHPTFPQEEIGRLKEQRLASIKQNKTDPGYLADTKFSAVLFGKHPYGQEPEGTETSIAAMAQNDFVQYHKNVYLPNNAFIVVAGDAAPDEIVPKLETVFGSWQKGKAVTQTFAAPKATDRTRIYIVDKPGAVQSAIRVGHLGIARDNSDFIKLYAMNVLLGGYFQSRINMNLRETHGYTYGAFSSFDARKFVGPFTVGADVRNEVTAEAVTEILNELKRLRDEPITNEELTTKREIA